VEDIEEADREAEEEEEEEESLVAKPSARSRP
jgi:hypothetical protein